MDPDPSQPLLPHSTIGAREQELLDVSHPTGVNPFSSSLVSPPHPSFLSGEHVAGVEPTFVDPWPVATSYFPISVRVDLSDLENRVFEKHQSRKCRKARQRIIDGKVKIKVRSDQAQQDIRHISVWVRREPKAAELCKDLNGEVELRVVCLEKKITHWVYQVDLDSVYDGPAGLVYELSRAAMNERNRFQLLIQVHCANDNNSHKVVSKPFLMRTHKRVIDQEKGAGNKRSWNTWSSPSKKRAVERRRLPVEDPDSTNSPLLAATPSSYASHHLDECVVNHLEAQRANIEHLTFGTMNTNRGDIAYHMKLTDPDMCQNLQEGVVVGFFPDSEGRTQIAPLTSDNSDEAVMAGVISRSAYIQAHAPATKDEGKTDVVCVIGMVKVQVEGTVRPGERVYASTNLPGTAIPESHLPLRAFMTKNHTLLGMAMESCKPRNHGEINLVKCFVCIVLGINNNQLVTEVENVLDYIEMDIKAAINKSSKKTWRKIYILAVVLLIFLVLLGFFLYEYFAPCTLFRYYLCRRGSISGHNLTFTYPKKDEKCPVIGVEFTFEQIRHRSGKRTVIPFNAVDSIGSPRYFLNLGRCACGTKQDRSDLPFGQGRPVCGDRILAVDSRCTPVYGYHERQWKPYNKTGEDPVCTPP